MQIFIVEDQVVQRDKLIEMANELISEHDYPFELNPVTEPVAILNEIKKFDPPNIYFLDIDLQSHKSGIDFALEIRELDVHGYIIFITSLTDKLYEIVEQYITPAAYVIKHESNILLSKSDIAFALQSVSGREKLRESTDIYTFMVGADEERLPYDDILYFETIPRTKKITLYTRNGIYTIVDFLKNVKESLSGHSQFSGVNSYLVNLNNVVSIDRKNGVIILVDDIKIHAGRRVINTIYKQFQELNRP
ncbi:response regulator transcription factor [Listeria grandensis]|uniref:Response regulator transcription factor n=1 Tax=Listeria grandensis TaxID=1494963 RepID=A0A7X0Y2U1_9LIST|nr:LytTR family DNA-binding domain-containing protein [Listeria grandensis]MBC1935848.1 response regulator transcription factor [Listeria grandensis]